MKSAFLIRDPQNNEEERLLSRFQEASRKIGDGKAGSGAEQAYSIAYQDLVKAGLFQQIKKKYR